MHAVPSSFVTLTYERTGPSLDFHDLALFLLRVRRHCGPTRYFGAGEYGEQGGRPHFHVLLFGRDFSDGVPCGKDIVASRTLQKLWKHGFSSAGEVTFDSAVYTAGYAIKKVSGAKAAAHYEHVDVVTGEITQRVPEGARMSLKPAIGATWFAKYWREVYNVRDGIVRPGGFVMPPPRHYDRMLDAAAERDATAKRFAELRDARRLENANLFFGDTTADRLAVRERCALAKARFLRRTL